MKKKQILMILLAIVLIIIVTIIVKKITAIRAEQNVRPTLVNGKSVEGQLLFNGVSVFSEKYIGYMTRKEITDRLKKMITEEIPEMNKEFSKNDDKEITEYFNENQDYLKENYGFTSEEEFRSFANYIINSNIKYKEYDKLIVDSETFKNDSDNNNYAYVEYTVKYLDNTKINFETYIAKNRYMNPLFIIRIIEE